MTLAQSVFLNLICHFTCILEFPPPAVLLYLPVTIQTRWIKGFCRDCIFWERKLAFPRSTFQVCAAISHEYGGYADDI